jgi:hypothetical protein
MAQVFKAYSFGRDFEISYKATDAAIPAFKDSVSFAMGIDKTVSQFS